MQELLPVIWSIAADVFVFQQEKAPAHRARGMMELLCRDSHTLFINNDYVTSQHY